MMKAITMQKQTIPVTIEKGKVAPITERYVNGEFQEVQRVRGDGVSRMAVCGLDNSHSRDYKVSYASDPLLVIKTTDDSVNHSQLRQILEDNGLWKDEFTKVDVPAPNNSWNVGFKSLPRSANMLNHFKMRMQNVVENDVNYLEGDDGATVYLPV